MVSAALCFASSFIHFLVLQLTSIRFPSILWQFLWNYIFGPVLLWKMRNIHEIYHWRLQTSLCIVAG